MERDEIYLLDLWHLFLRQWKWFALSVVVALGLAYLYSHSVRRQWEATAWVQLAQVGVTPGRDGEDLKVEPILRVMERLQYVPFQDQVLASQNVSPKSPEAHLYRKSMKLEPQPYAGPLVKMTVRGFSPEQARSLAEATVVMLRATQEPDVAQALSYARSRASQVETALQQARAERDRLSAVAGGADAKSVSPTQAMAAVLLASKAEEVRTLEASDNNLKARLGKGFTFDTSLAWPVYVPEGQVFPNVALTWGIALLLGLAVGAMLAVARESLRRRVRTPT